MPIRTGPWPWLFVCAVVACGPRPPARVPPSEHPRALARARPAARPHAHHGPDAPCAAKHHGKCFASPDAACAAAGCADQRCEVIAGKPARVLCDDLR